MQKKILMLDEGRFPNLRCRASKNTSGLAGEGQWKEHGWGGSVRGQGRPCNTLDASGHTVQLETGSVLCCLLAFLDVV